MIKLSVKGSLKQNKNILKKFVHRKNIFLKRILETLIRNVHFKHYSENGCKSLKNAKINK